MDSLQHARSGTTSESLNMRVSLNTHKTISRLIAHYMRNIIAYTVAIRCSAMDWTYATIDSERAHKVCWAEWFLRIL